jgi:divalent metal cation (Fe/Co/Zn/Cd) transporter
VSREDYVAIASRLFAIFLFVMVARSIPSAIALIGQEGPQPSLWLVGLVLASGIAICVVLWLFPLTIARKLLPVMKEPRSDSQMSESVALSIGLTLLGVWVLATALPDLIYWGTLFQLSRQIEYGEFDWGAEQIAGITSSVAELALALWLIFASSGIRRLIYRFRYVAS